ncbi:RNase H domain-containing protein [Trichonephila clavipes]|nr:RNase H domain-containing protein [Trichonephila clavipes]
MWELKRASPSAHNTSPGPDGISYELLRHLNEDSLVSLLYLFNRLWREQVYSTQWQEATAIPILKPGKDQKDPLSYRPMALTSCLCKTLERMAIARFVYQLEKNRYIPLFQSGFRKGRCTLDNIMMLENKVWSNTSWGADRRSLLSVYQAVVLSRINYGCVVYASTCKSTLKKLDSFHHISLRICSDAFRTSPVQSLYVNCHQLPLDLRRRKLSLAYY